MCMKLCLQTMLNFLVEDFIFICLKKRLHDILFIKGAGSRDIWAMLPPTREFGHTNSSVAGCSVPPYEFDTNSLDGGPLPVSLQFSMSSLCLSCVAPSTALSWENLSVMWEFMGQFATFIADFEWSCCKHASMLPLQNGCLIYPELYLLLSTDTLYDKIVPDELLLAVIAPRLKVDVNPH